MFSKRIQKFNTFSKLQLQNLDYSYNGPTVLEHSDDSDKEKSNLLKAINDRLYSDTELNIDQVFSYKKEGKKNAIIGKIGNFKNFFALFLKQIEKENGFEKMMEILQDKPDREEIFTVFFVLNNCFNYIHIDYFKEKAPILRSAILEFINNIDDEKTNAINKDFRNILLDLFNKINKVKITSDQIQENNVDNGEKDFLYEITLNLTFKEIKESTFNAKLNDIKYLDDIIDKNKNNKNMRETLIEFIEKNNLKKEIFGIDYNCQIFYKSKELDKLFLLENQLDKEDIQLKWNYTKEGNLGVKISIMKLISELDENLKEEYFEIILNDIKSTKDPKKINHEEIELIYKLSLQSKNKNNILICCEYLFNFLLASSTTKINNNPFLEKLLIIAQKDDEYLKKILEISVYYIKNNEKAILSYAILLEVMKKINPRKNECINAIIKDKYLLNLYQDNFKLYNQQANDFMEKNNIQKTDYKARDKFVINGFTHLSQVNQRIEVLEYLIKYFYKDFDFIPFLKEIFITKAVSPNDKLLFYQFIKSFMNSGDSFGGKENIKLENKIKQQLFEFISENEKDEVTLEKMNLLISVFLEINKDKIIFEEKEIKNDNNEYNKLKMFDIKRISLENIEDLKFLDKFWEKILKVQSENVLPQAINVLYKIYQTNFLPQLLEKFKKLMFTEESNPQIFGKYIKLLKLIIIESEKNILFRPKSHLSLLKNCLINFPLYLRNKDISLNGDEIEKVLLPGNATINDLKIIESKLFKMPTNAFEMSLSDEFYNKIKKCENLEDKYLYNKKKLDESYNNISIYQLFQVKNKLILEKKQNEKIYLKTKDAKLYRETLLKDNELNPKFVKVLKIIYEEFTDGEGKMYPKGIAKFIRRVSPLNDDINEDDVKVKVFLENNDKDKKGYVNEEEFLLFYKESLLKEKTETVWKHLKNMKIREDLKKVDEPIDIEYVPSEKLLRYQLGNDLDFIKALIKQYYKNPEENDDILELLTFLTTNQNIYNEVLNLFNNNEENLVNKNINGENNNNYVELNYIFIIIESILEDLEIYLLLEHDASSNEIKIGNKEYELLQEKYEPFDNEENKEKKINFLKSLIKSENFNKIIKIVNILLINTTQMKNNSKILEVLFDCCFRGIKIINILFKLKSESFTSQVFDDNCVNELKEKYIYHLGYSNLSKLLKGVNYENELNNISYSDLVNNLINFLNKENIEKI